MSGNLHVYQASAGSGKTYTLTLEYLKLLFEGIRDDKGVKYNSILVVTFTNKATVELRDRILSKLFELSQGTSDLEESLLSHLWGNNSDGNKSHHQSLLRNYAGRALKEILLDYSHFRVQTIDSFFQEIVRSFVLEIDRLHSGFEVEIDQAGVVALSMEEMLRELSDGVGDKSLEESLASLYDAKSEADERVRLRSDLAKYMASLLDDPLMDLAVSESEKFDHKGTKKDRVKQALIGLQAVLSAIEARLSNAVKKTHKLLESWDVDEENPLDKSYQKALRKQLTLLEKPMSELVASWLKDDLGLLGGYVKTLIERIELDPKKWTSDKKSADKLSPEKIEQLRVELRALKAISGDNELKKHYHSAATLVKYLNWLPVLIEFRKKIDDFQSDNGIVLISEINDLLSEVVGDSDAPFIYLKVGTGIDHFLIDEFQDTNATQWHNFLPLLIESLSNHNRNYIVGDVKQSIYRFRGGDSELLGKVLPEVVGRDNIEHLGRNYRSAKTIVDFNNAFFSDIYSFSHFVEVENGSKKDTDIRYPLVTLEDEDADPTMKAHKIIYEARNVTQLQPDKNPKQGGYVACRKELFDKDQLRSLIDGLLDEGYAPGDIAILVRKNYEAEQIADMLKRLSEEVEEGKEKYRFISNYALQIANARTVQFLSAYIHFLANPASQSAKDAFEMSLFNLRPDHFFSAEEADVDPLAACSDAFVRIGSKGLSIYQAVNEVLAEVGKLRPIPDEERVYLNAFMDKLFEFSGRYVATYGRFDEWWRSKKESLFVEMSSAKVDAIMIHTIHKVKGLEFPVVILPFANWDIVGGKNNKDKDIALYDFASDKVRREMDGLRKALPEEDPAVTYPDDLSYAFFHKTPTPRNVNSVFAPVLLRELEAQYLDALNLLYVAFTRPSERLYVFYGVKKTENKVTSAIAANGVSKIIDEALSKIKAPEVAFDGVLFTMGERLPAPNHDDAAGDEIIESGTGEKPLPGELKIRKRGYTNTHTERGIDLHERMSLIHTPDDIDRALGNLSNEEDKILANRLKRAIASPEADPLLSFFFNPPKGWILLLEHSMHDADAKRTYRTDRLLINPSTHEAYMIDYKFGEERSEYKRQQQAYMRTLDSMGYTPKGYLWYNLSKIVEVPLR